MWDDCRGNFHFWGCLKIFLDYHVVGFFYGKHTSGYRGNFNGLEIQNAQYLLFFYLLITFKGFNEMDVTLLECPTWGKRQKKGDKRVLLDVIKAVKTERSDHKGRVLVLSR